jgi:hypothetical protein
MVVEKASGSDSPLRQGAEKSSWILPISRQRRRRLTVCFVESDPSSRFFPSRGTYRRKGSVRRWASWPHPLVARARGRPRHARVWLAHVPPPSHLRSSRSFSKNRRFGFCFIQFQEYFLCSFSETQKQ